MKLSMLNTEVFLLPKALLLYKPNMQNWNIEISKQWKNNYALVLVNRYLIL